MLCDKWGAAARLKIGLSTLWTLTNCRAIPSRKIGRSVRYAVWELEAWINAGCPTEPNAADAILRGLRNGGDR
jgi:predicted DNA-binding transcriptional regulator AlpA